LSNLRGDQVVKSKKGRSKVVPKLIRKQAEWRYPALSEPFLNTDDLFNASPKTFEDKASSEQNEQVLNYQFSHQINKVKFIDEYVRTVTDEGTVIVKVGWDFEEEEKEVEYENEYGEIEIGTEMVPTKNQPTLEVCRYDAIVIDPTCEGEYDKAQFIIHSFETSTSELKKDGRYENVNEIDTSLNSSVTDNIEDRNDSFSFLDEPRKKFIVREYHGFWDYNDDGIAKQIICTWAGNVIIRMVESPYPFQKLPFVGVQYLPVRKSNFGQPDGELLEDNQKIVGAVTRGMIDIMGRSANGQTGTRKDALDTVNSRKFERGDDYKFNASVDVGQAFNMGVYPEVPRSALEMINLQNADAESLTGVKAFSSGITGNSLGSTATGIRSAMDATAKREMGILRRLGNGVIQIGHMILKMNQEWLSDEEIIRVTNEPVKILREELAGEYDIMLGISTPEADAEKASGLEFMLQTLGNNLPFEFTQIILSDIAKLRKQPGLAMKISEYKQQPDPAAEKASQLQLALLEAQVANENAKAQENTVDVDLKRAKTATEEAKARQMHSGSDIKDLDFVEQEAGVGREHERDMEGIKSDNRSNEKVVDAMIKDEQSTGAAGPQQSGYY